MEPEAGASPPLPVRGQRREEEAVEVMRRSCGDVGKPETWDVLEATSGKVRTECGEQTIGFHSVEVTGGRGGREKISWQEGKSCRATPGFPQRYLTSPTYTQGQ